MIEMKNIYKKFGDLELFKDFNISFKDNEISCILGPSGTGKTTIINMISGLTKPDRGNIYGINNSKFSYVFQEPRLLNWYSVYENINFVLKDIINEAERKIIIKKYLKIVGLWEYKDFKPKTLSGGMAQRVSIARAFAFPSNILIMDEPFVGLDIKLKKDLIDSFIKIWNEDKRTVLYITHDIDDALKLSNKIYVIKKLPAKVIKIFNLSSEENTNYIKNELIKII